ncbi:assimilatory nitrate reductase catalytic subunit [Tistlia consotensis]|uniref:Assimilatory nitrate reductase (NADH) alpha subunit apoprotein n=1 Tax=Tistlia consotensis USBA 355 TaxID=560819 RepID=A0A1Y6C4B6_9PROT|nr:nitrate reductase [Tistlia consotensis]SMF36327.1 assimilatory nitrate reductase (NADH) alpha subunit apoprotein [Tistlia consotensis USBA 355]SNR71699.1 assimilatory nitrate reductase catalytic subunit [Tistlia consotensis]
MAEGVRTTCPYCGTGCGVVASRARDGWAVGGDPEHPANHGRLCSKGAALPDVLGTEGRLLRPTVDGETVGWPAAIAAVASRLRAVVEESGPDAVAFYVSGQLLTEDYYVANKLLKGFIGSPHIDTNSRLCMASTVAGHKRAFGADVVPGCYEDLDEAELIVLVGSNLAWCHPILHRRVRAARDRGARLVVIDPRRSATCDDADLHLALKPGSDVALFNGLLAELDRRGRLDRAWAAGFTRGLEATLEAARAEATDLAAVAAACDLPLDALEGFCELLAGTPRTVTLFSQGVNQSSSGSDKVNAILNLHLATGRIGRPGMGPFSVTGQPNAMGGREVGGLANQLAAHMDPDDPDDLDRLRRFWRAPNLRGGQGLKALELFEAVAARRIRALWIAGTNPAVSLPEAETVRAALAACPLVVVSDVTADSDTARFADILLPAAAWSEKDGTVTNSERRISRQRGFRAPPGEARPDWWIFAQVGRALGYGRAFAWRHPSEIFREHARLSAFENGGSRAFDIGGLADLSRAAYDALEPVQWPFAKGGAPTARLFATGGFFTPDGWARLVPLRRSEPKERPSFVFPLLANSGRYRDQWHSMTRTGLAARLAGHRPEPLVELHPRDAARLGLADGSLAHIESRHGAAVMRVAASEAQRPGEVFLPIHWTDAYASRAVVGRLVAGHRDPLSGQPESKHTPVRLRPFKACWSGLLLSRRAVSPAGIGYWCRSAGAGCQLVELAGEESAPPAWLVEQPLAGAGLERLDYRDSARGVRRLAWLDGDRLEAALFLAPDRPQVARAWLQGLFGRDALGAAERAGLLAGRTPEAAADRSRLVCACFAVGLAEISAALADGRATSAPEVGRLLSAGTGCGSCLPEIEALVRAGRERRGPEAA